MKRTTIAISAAALFCTAISPLAPAQTYYYSSPPVAVAAPVQTPIVILAPQQLDQLAAPVALYPDPLVAQVLTAATYPLDLVTAAQWARANPNAPDPIIDSQPWPPPVKALVHYPTVLDQLANNLTWTQQLGSAYLNQPADVMSSIQRLRYQAQAAGTLVSTPQQQVIVQNNVIYVIPAQPDVIYVPVYDPGVVYARREPLRFSAGFHIGTWLDLDLDWHDHFVASGVRWDRAHWEHYHDLPEHRVEVVHEPRPNRVAWTRDPGHPVVIAPPHPEPEHRFYPTPAPAPHPVSTGSFGDYRGRVEVEHEENRGRQSLHQPSHEQPPHEVHAPPGPQHDDHDGRDGGHDAGRDGRDGHH